MGRPEAGCAGSGRSPPGGVLGLDGAGPIGREPGRGRGGVRGRASGSCFSGPAATGSTGGAETAGSGLAGGSCTFFGCETGGSSSTRSFRVDGTIRPVGITGLVVVAGGVGGSGFGGVGGSGFVGVGGSGFVGVSGSGFVGRLTVAVSMGVAFSAGGVSLSTVDSSSMTGGETFGDLIRRGGPNCGRGAGSGVFESFRLRFEGAGFVENNGPDGKLRLCSRAVRSANCLATISSIVLEALLTSIPWSCLRRSITLWLGIPSTSATL